MAQSVLFISYDGMTDPLGQSQVLPYLCGLSGAGFRITLLSCEKPERFAAGRDTIQAICDNAGINWTPVFYTARPPVLSTIKDIRNLWKTAVRLHTEHRFSLVHCRSYISALIGQKMKKKFGTKFLFDMRGFWADERVDGGLWNLKNPLFRKIYRYFKRKEKEFIREADHVISLTQHAKDEIYSWPAFAAKKPSIQVIPCCVDLGLFDPSRITPAMQESYRRKLGIADGSFILSYLGSLGTWYLLDDMLLFFQLLKQRIPSAKFLFISHDRHEEILQKAAQMGFADAVIIRPGARNEVPVLLSLSNYSIYFIKPAYSKKASSPTKQGEIMAMGIPSVCNEVGDMPYVAATYGIGFTVDTEKKQNFQAVADRIANAGTQFSPQQIMDGARAFYSLEKGIALYTATYREVLGNVTD